MQDSIVEKLTIALISSGITFILGVIYNTWIQHKQFKLSTKSFIAVYFIQMKKDFHHIQKGEKARHIITDSYNKIRTYYNTNKQFLVPDLSYISIKNLGPGTVMQCDLKASYYVSEIQYEWTVDCTIDFIEKDETIFINIDDMDAPAGTFFNKEVVITYQTQANQEIKVNIMPDQESYLIKYSTKTKWRYKMWTQYIVPQKLVWESPNK